MDVLPVHPQGKPQFSLGQKIWYINCRKEVDEDQIRAIDFKLVRHEGKDQLFCVGYDLQTVNIDAPGLPFMPYDLYETKELADQLAVWHPITNMTDEQWEAAIGDREKETTEESELSECCSRIARVRDLLITCRQDGGLLERDVRVISNLITGDDHNIVTTPEKFPNLQKICAQLNVNVKPENEEDKE